MKTTSALSFTLIALMLLLSSVLSHATLILQESFDYGTTPGTLNGLGSAGGGWGGSWTTQNNTYTGSPTFTEAYQTGGLTFTSLAVSGGNAFVGVNGDGFLNAGRAHTASITGTLYGSYLFRTTSTSASVLSLFEGTGLGLASASSQFAIEPMAYAGGGLGGVITGGAYTYGSGTGISAFETYLVLYKVTGLGGSNVSQTAKMWMLRDSQYDNFISGGLTESELDSAGLGSTATDVLQRSSRTITNSAAFASGDLLTLQAYFAPFGAQFDELRVSDTSFNELVLGSVPEPSRALLLATGMLSLILRRRR